MRVIWIKRDPSIDQVVVAGNVGELSCLRDRLRSASSFRISEMGDVKFHDLKDVQFVRGERSESFLSDAGAVLHVRSEDIDKFGAQIEVLASAGTGHQYLDVAKQDEFELVVSLGEYD